MLKVCTWNVNGIRSLKKPFDVFSEIGADVICIQEAKISRFQVDESVAFPGNEFSSCFTFPKQTSGYSGCGTYFRELAKPFSAEYGIYDEENGNEEWSLFVKTVEGISQDTLKSLDSEGRCLVTCHQIKILPDNVESEQVENHKDSTSTIILPFANDIKKLYIFNIYFPRLDVEKEGRIEFKEQFNKIIEHKVHNILQDPNSHVIIACDLNISHQRIDNCDPEEDFELSIYRVWLSQFLTPDKLGNRRHMVDSFRKLYPDKKEAYTCWNNQLVGSRASNYGTRIDYLLIDSELVKHVSDVLILNQIQGSDHCPVLCEIQGVEWVPSKNYPPKCTRLWPEFGIRKKQTNLKDFFKTIEKQKPKCVVPAKKSHLDLLDGDSSDSTVVEIVVKTPAASSQIQKSPKVNANNIEKPQNAFDVLMSGPPKPPLCQGHLKPCQMFISNKKGKNYKRRFWSCAQPAGDPSKPETKCSYFRWLPK